jgi:phenylacetic acid degradation operon negative regulatory protein
MEDANLDRLKRRKKKSSKIYQKSLSSRPGEKAGRRIIAQKVSQITQGLFSNLADFTLYFLLFLPTASLGKPATSSGIYHTFQEADQALGEINYDSFKNAIRKLKEKGFLNNFKEWKNKKIATIEGTKRLNSVLPFYHEERFWDGNFYIVQYDIPLEQNRIRNLLRELLKRLGSIKLQKSSYLLFYNPQDLIKQFLSKHQEFSGNILISQLTKHGILGNEDMVKFLWQQAGLEEINLEYKEFIDKYRSGKNFSHQEMFIDYFSILKKDPQIPFELLPTNYLGDKAYLLFLKYFKTTLYYEHMYFK